MVRSQVEELVDKQLSRGGAPEYDSIRRQHVSLPKGEKERFAAALCSAAIWSCTEKVPFEGERREICWLINRALDLDDEKLLKRALPLIRSLSKFCVVERRTMKHLSHVTLKSRYNGGQRTFRGGGMNEEYMAFFT